MSTWKVVPVCHDQMRDVNPEDLIDFSNVSGLFRRCHTYKGGGGYDHFPAIACKRGFVSHEAKANVQFVVQIRGCPLDCPYCYVTRQGVWGDTVALNHSDLVSAYERAQETHGVNVFHLMGGAPALQLKHWADLIDSLQDSQCRYLFHSDLMLIEGQYKTEWLQPLNDSNVLLAVNIKGLDAVEWEKNTRKPFDASRIAYNLNQLREHLNFRNWYLTFTGIDPIARNERIQEWKMHHHVDNQYGYHIDLIEYNAMPYVDNIAWGAMRKSELNSNSTWSN